MMAIVSGSARKAGDAPKGNMVEGVLSSDETAAKYPPLGPQHQGAFDCFNEASFTAAIISG